MELIQQNENLWTLENIGLLSTEQKADIILSLSIKPNDMVLFQYLKSSQIEASEEEKDFMLEAYLEGYLGFKKSSTKDFIDQEIKKVFEELNIYKNQDRDILSENELFTRLFENTVSFSPDVLKKVKNIIYQNAISEIEETVPEEVLKNVVYSNSFHVEITNSSCLKKDDRLSVLWYALNDKMQLRQAIEDEIFYRGVITSDNQKFNNYFCAFQYYETASDYNLDIYFKKQSESIETVINKIEVLCKNF
ncbi:hypothetical protein [uncultured Brevibacillus sp.]|uniref:hypothetical protein n=1 Tax=uncultured Brevibacillus sp. TaxID=169970 RepID=UPI002599E01A|nr:hypothetical protein [uncultured Brevibacillus sp.]